jgi:hypothetical protein
MAKAAPAPTRRYSVLSPIGVQDDDGTFTKLKVGSLVDLTDAEHAELLKLAAVAEDPIEDRPAQG